MPKKEKAFETQIRKYLESEGCYCFKVWGGGFQRAGIPDLLICVNGYFVAVEVKGDMGKASELQVHNLVQIRKAGGIGILLYPEAFDTFKSFVKTLKLKPTANKGFY